MAKRRLRRRSYARGAGIQSLEPRRLLGIITVTGTGDTIAADGLVTLREAITSTNGNSDANADVTAQHTGGAYSSSPSADSIHFNIAGAGVHTISVGELPTITDPVIIDGYTQPGSAMATSSTPATLLIELNPANPDNNGDALVIDTINSVIRGLVINTFGGAGITLTTMNSAA